MKFRVITMAAAFAVAALATPVHAKTFRYAFQGDLNALDPYTLNETFTLGALGNVMEGLTKRDKDLKIIPGLAESWEIVEPTRWRFHLRKGVKFHGGEPFTADDVIFSAERALSPESNIKSRIAAGTKLVKVDDHTVDFVLSSPNPILHYEWDTWYIFSKTWAEANGATKVQTSSSQLSPFTLKANGTGPFKVESWKKQDAVNLVRNENYVQPVATPGHEGAAYLDGITWRFIPEAATRYAALQAGEVQIIDNAQPDTIAAAAKNQAVKHLDAPRPGAANRIELNSSKAPFNDSQVREAFVHAVNVNAGVDSLFFGTAPRSYSPLSSVEPLAYSAESLFAYDPAKAAELLDAAGWTERDSEGYRTKDGERLSLSFPVSTSQSIPAEQSLFEQLQATAKESGIEIKINLLDLSSWYGELFKNDYNLVSAPYTKVGPSVLSILFHSDSTIPAPSGYFANLSQVKDPSLDALLETAGSTEDEAQRKELYAQAQKLVLEGYYLLPLYNQQNHFLYSSNLQNVGTTTAVATPTFFDTWLAK